jgi:hypothetical protein
VISWLASDEAWLVATVPESKEQKKASDESEAQRFWRILAGLVIS